MTLFADRLLPSQFLPIQFLLGDFLSGPVLARMTAGSLALLLASCAGMARPTGPVEVHVLALNDFHGNLEAPSNVSLPDPANPGSNIPPGSGGAARLATLVAQLAARSPDTIMVAAGDLIGASPLLSSLFHDEPTIESLSQMGLALSAVGNHEFDEGAAELRRLQQGGCHPEAGCAGPHPFKGAAFTYLAASTLETATGRTLFPATSVRTFGGVKVGFIGLTLAATPTLIAPASAAGLTFLDEATTINAEAAKLRADGVEAIVVLIHEGGFPASGSAAGADACAGLSGPITQIVPKLDRAVDVIVSGHTHSAYVCTVDGRLLTSAGRYGVMLTDMTLTLDRKTRDIMKSEATNIVVRKDIHAEAPAQLALIGAYKALAEPLMNRPVGALATPLTKPSEGVRDSAIGDVIADGMREAALREAGETVDIAFMNPGGVRSDIPEAGAVTYGDIFAVQPFGNALIVMTLTGAEIEAVLRQQFQPGRTFILHVSEGFSYRWRQTPAGEAGISPGSITLNGKPLDPAAAYRIVTNNFLATGGDGFTAFRAGRAPVNAGGDADALENYIRAHSPVSAPPGGRVVKE